ncbi:MAG: DUF1127 domain-containing protein [Rhodobacteraceae bacterium]|nr:DUF1127 domain-containing protein [Paracoccaceae bacterium]
MKSIVLHMPRPATDIGAPTLLDRLVAVYAAWQERRKLADMDAERLRDLGLSQADIAAEMARPMRDIPSFPRA